MLLRFSMIIKVVKLEGKSRTTSENIKAEKIRDKENRCDEDWAVVEILGAHLILARHP